MIRNKKNNPPTALVTGGAIRIGKAITEELHAAGFRIAIHYHSNVAKARALQRRLPGSTIHAADLRDPASFEALAGEVAAAHGKIDVLVNSAADFFPTPLGKTTVAQWDQLHHLNLRAPYFLAQAVRPWMPTSGGVIINIADVGGENPLPHYIPYATTKAGVISLTRGLARELAPKIRVNAVSPGPVLHPERYTAAQRRKSVASTLLGRAGTPQNVAHAVRFLVENDYVTGVILAVDGGRTLV